MVAAVRVAALFRPIGGSADPKIPIIDVLVAGVPDPTPLLEASREGLREHGCIEGKNIRLDIPAAEGRPQRLTPLA